MKLCICVCRCKTLRDCGSSSWSSFYLHKQPKNRFLSTLKCSLSFSVSVSLRLFKSYILASFTFSRIMQISSLWFLSALFSDSSIFHTIQEMHTWTSFFSSTQKSVLKLVITILSGSCAVYFNFTTEALCLFWDAPLPLSLSFESETSLLFFLLRIFSSSWELFKSPVFYKWILKVFYNLIVYFMYFIYSKTDAFR